MKKVLFDILHPAHLHFFSKTFDALRAQDLTPIICTRDKDITPKLATEMGLTHQILSTSGQKKGRLPFEAIHRSFELQKIISHERPHLLVGVMGVFIAPLGRINRIPSVVFYDTETARWSNRMTFLLANRVCAPTSFQWTGSTNIYRYPSFQTFSALYERALKIAGHQTQTPRNTILFRFVARNSSHELLEQKASWNERIAWVNNAQLHYQVIISSESPLPPALLQFQYRGKPSDLHSLIASAKIVFSESATVCSEAACLGVRSFYVSDSPRGYLQELEEKYDLVHQVKNHERSAFLNLLQNNTWESVFSTDATESHRQLLRDKIDPNPFILEQIYAALPK